MGHCSAFKAEIWGILDGLRLAKKLNLNNITIESDSLAAVQVILSTDSGGEGVCNIVQQIRSFLSGRWNVKLKHIYREANKCADWLANWSLQHDLGYIEWTHAPSGISSLLLYDAMGLSTSRLISG